MRPSLQSLIGVRTSRRTSMASYGWRRICERSSTPTSNSTRASCARLPPRRMRARSVYIGRLGLQPAGASEASLSDRARPRLPYAPVSQTAGRTAPAGHISASLSTFNPNPNPDPNPYPGHVHAADRRSAWSDGEARGRRARVQSSYINPKTRQASKATHKGTPSSKGAAHHTSTLVYEQARRSEATG